MILKYNCDHIVGDIAGFLDPSNDQVVELSQFEELVTSRSRHWHKGPAIVPIWSDNCGVYFEDQIDLCPYCGDPGERNGLWVQWCVDVRFSALSCTYAGSARGANASTGLSAKGPARIELLSKCSAPRSNVSPILTGRTCVFPNEFAMCTIAIL